MQETRYQVHCEDVLAPKYGLKAKSNGTVCISKGSQWLKHFALVPKLPGEGRVNAVSFHWLQLVECYATKDKKWLLYRIEGAAYAEKKRCAPLSSIVAVSCVPCSVEVHLMEWLIGENDQPYLGKKIVTTGCKLKQSDDLRFDIDFSSDKWAYLLELVDNYEKAEHSDYPLKSTSSYLQLEVYKGDMDKIIDHIMPAQVEEVERMIAADRPSRSNSVGSENSEGADIAIGVSPPTGRMQRHVCSPRKDNETPAQHIARYKEKLDLTRCAANLG